MKSWSLLLVGAIATIATTTATATAADNVASESAKRCFPDDFLFGSATAAYQVEGAWNETGRTSSIWDDFCRERGLQCANVADDFVHRYKDDIQLMVASGLDTFRFSISWSRAMNWDAATKKMKANPQGIAFYHALIDELKRNNIMPILTLYHWDLPSELHHELKPQGWINREIVDHFVEYAELMFTEFGSKVDYWTTFNEPHSFIAHGYGIGREAPGMTNSKTNAYTVTHNVLISHGKAVQRFRELKKTSVIHDKARISIVLNYDYSHPLNASDPMDVAASERKIQFTLGWFSTPIVFGKYPDIMRERVGDNLPEFTEEEAAIVKDSYDLFMLNHYATKAVVDCKSPLSTVKCSDQSLGWESDLGIDESRAPPGARLSSKDENGQYNCKWFTGYPSGYLETIKWMHAQNPKAEILLTENGWCGNDSIDNQDQLWYFQSYLGEVYKAINELKIPIIGYTAWSFMDNYEWGSFKPRFGLYYVNFTSETGKADEVTPGPTALARIPRTAAKWYAQLSKTKCLDGIEIDGVPVVAETDEIDATSSTSSGFKTIVLWGLVVAFAVAVPAIILYLTRHHRARQSTADEATPLVRGQMHVASAMQLCKRSHVKPHITRAAKGHLHLIGSEPIDQFMERFVVAVSAAHHLSDPTVDDQRRRRPSTLKWRSFENDGALFSITSKISDCANLDALILSPKHPPCNQWHEVQWRVYQAEVARSWPPSQLNLSSLPKSLGIEHYSHRRLLGLVTFLSVMKCLQLLLAGVSAVLATVSAGAAAATASAVTTSASAKRCFPDDFLFGSATAAYQVEGAWNETGRTPSIWDDFCREKPGLQCSNVADDFYHRYHDDIQLMVASGLDSFRFSISWSRVMNWDVATKKMKANPPGIAFYHAMIDELKRSNIVPILTLYHWDLPTELHNNLAPQGWLNPEIVDHFVQYAELMFNEFGSKVDMWTTFNEPLSFVAQGYATGMSAPGYTNSKTNAYVVAHNVLLSHGRAVQRFRELKKSSVVHEKARIGIVVVDHFYYPLDPSNPRDVIAAERAIQFGFGWFFIPIVTGKYPDVMRERVGDRLPEFTTEEAAMVKDSYDLFMVNHYSSHTVTDCDSETSLVKCSDLSLGWEQDMGVDSTRAPEGARLSSKNSLGEYNCKWFTGYPAGYLEMIRWVHKYNTKADILLTENGWCGNETIENMDQLWYYQGYVDQVHKAITEFNIPVIGYTAWSFYDNYEWGSFNPRFGLYYVNFTSETGLKDEITPGPNALARIPRPAAKWYAQVAKTKCLDGFEIEGVPVLAGVTDVAGASSGSGFKTFALWGLVLGVVVAVPAVAFVVKSRRSRQSSLLRAGENTPLVRGQ